MHHHLIISSDCLNLEDCSRDSVGDQPTHGLTHVRTRLYKFYPIVVWMNAKVHASEDQTTVPSARPILKKEIQINFRTTCKCGKQPKIVNYVALKN